MSVSKRLRFEILRRDNHTCRYCGRSAPDVPLRVDHVTPEALGGRTEPSNLVTACEPCNSGKSSVALDGAMVDDIQADALRFAEVTRQAYAVLAEKSEARQEYWESFDRLWSDTFHMPQPDDAYATVSRWHDMGVPITLIYDAANIAFAASLVKDRFRYMCGIIWNQVQTVTAEAAVKAALDGAWVTAVDAQDAGIKGFLEAADWYRDEIAAARLVEDFVDWGSSDRRWPRRYLTPQTEEVPF